MEGQPVEYDLHQVLPAAAASHRHTAADPQLDFVFYMVSGTVILAIVALLCMYFVKR